MKFFWELCAGPRAPLTAAFHRLDRATVEPIDHPPPPQCGGHQHNLLDASFQGFALRLAWAGIIIEIWLGTPCEGFSMLKMLPGGRRRCAPRLHSTP